MDIEKLPIKKSALNPLWIICIFFSFAETILGYAVFKTTDGIQITLTVFVIIFPVYVATMFFIILWNRPKHLYAPTDYQKDESFLESFKPPPDYKLPEIDKKITVITGHTTYTNTSTITNSTNDKLQLTVPEDNIQLFKIRYSIENELRRIWNNRTQAEDFEKSFRTYSLNRLVDILIKYEILDNSFASVLRDILGICNYAVHGETITKNQTEFVVKNADRIMNYLKSIK